MELLRRIRRWAEGWHLWPFRHLSKALYWLRTHTYNRYHMLDMRSKVNGYTWGWYDRSTLILFANMALLRDFIEQEKAFDCHVDWDSDEGHKNARLEMLTIYDWWMKGRPAEHKKGDDLLEAAYPGPMVFEPIPGSTMLRLKNDETPELRKLRDQCIVMEEALEKKDEEMLIRLIKVRGYMWT